MRFSYPAQSSSFPSSFELLISSEATVPSSTLLPPALNPPPPLPSPPLPPPFHLCPKSFHPIRAEAFRLTLHTLYPRRSYSTPCIILYTYTDDLVFLVSSVQNNTALTNRGLPKTRTTTWTTRITPTTIFTIHRPTPKPDPG